MEFIHDVAAKRDDVVQAEFMHMAAVIATAHDAVHGSAGELVLNALKHQTASSNSQTSAMLAFNAGMKHSRASQRHTTQATQDLRSALPLVGVEPGQSNVISFADLVLKPRAELQQMILTDFQNRPLTRG